MPQEESTVVRKGSVAAAFSKDERGLWPWLLASRMSRFSAEPEKATEKAIEKAGGSSGTKKESRMFDNKRLEIWRGELLECAQDDMELFLIGIKNERKNEKPGPENNNGESLPKGGVVPIMEREQLTRLINDLHVIRKSGVMRPLWCDQHWDALSSKQSSPNEAGEGFNYSNAMVYGEKIGSVLEPRGLPYVFNLYAQCNVLLTHHIALTQTKVDELEARVTAMVDVPNNDTGKLKSCCELRSAHEKLRRLSGLYVFTEMMSTALWRCGAPSERLVRAVESSAADSRDPVIAAFESTAENCEDKLWQGGCSDEKQVDIKNPGDSNNSRDVVVSFESSSYKSMEGWLARQRAACYRGMFFRFLPHLPEKLLHGLSMRLEGSRCKAYRVDFNLVIHNKKASIHRALSTAILDDKPCSDDTIWRTVSRHTGQHDIVEVLPMRSSGSDEVSLLVDVEDIVFMVQNNACEEQVAKTKHSRREETKATVVSSWNRLGATLMKLFRRGDNQVRDESVANDLSITDNEISNSSSVDLPRSEKGDVEKHCFSDVQCESSQEGAKEQKEPETVVIASDITPNVEQQQQVNH